MLSINLEKESLISFPGLGIDDFVRGREAFDLCEIFNMEGSFPIYWYGIIITLGILTAFAYVVFRGKYESVSFDSILDIGLWTVICGVAGARLYYVFTKLEEFMPESFNLFEFLGNVVNLRDGGLGIYGGIIAGALAIVVVTQVKKINTLKLLDMAAPAVMIAQSMGRWGNFFNGEAFGGIVAEGHPLYFIRMGIISTNSIFDFGTANMVYVHPTFLYESLWNLVGFILINIFYNKKKFNGQIACMYLSWYGIGRFFIEALRTDSLYIPGTDLRISQVIGMACFIIFGALLVWGFIYSRKYKNGDAELNKFDAVIKPSLVTPVFFAKKGNAVAENVEEDDNAHNECAADVENDKNGKDN